MILKGKSAFVAGIFVMSFMVTAAGAATSTILQKTSKKYYSLKSASAKVERVLVLSALSQERKADGQLKIKSGGKVRLELMQPEKSLLISNGKALWSVTYPTDTEFDNTTRVSRTKNLKSFQSNTLVAMLFGKKSLIDSFKILKEEKKQDTTVYDLEPKEKNLDIQSVKLEVKNKSSEILSIEYSDALKNKTKYVFAEWKFGTSIKNSEFNFEIPKGAEVTDF